MSEPYARKGGGTAHGRTPYRQVSQDDTDGSGVRRARLATWSKLPESLNFTTEENEVWRTKHAQLQYTNRNRWWTSHNAVVFKRWVLTFIIGVLAGLVGTFITFFTRKLTDYKFEKVRSVMDAEGEGSYRGSSFFCYLGFNLLYVSVAILCVYIEPVSAGSGIPEVKCYLNGINVPRIVRVRTLFCKAFGVLFSVAAALPVGKEGPMIHSGSVIGASLAQGTRGLFGTLGDTRVLEFRSDPEKRDFVACGAAAGVATAFGAPIGGVLFALEEGASFWSTQLTWRAFFCGMITIYTLYVVRTSEDLWGSADSTKMFSFGEFTYKTSDGKANFSVWELLLFTALGALGGLAGALFNHLNKRLTQWRMRHCASKALRALEAWAVCVICSTVMYVVPCLWRRCTPKPLVQVTWTQFEKNLVEDLVPFGCPADSYNEVASLFFTDSDTAIKQLFHFRESGVFNQDVQTFSSLAIATFYVPYFLCACLTYGIAVPSGLFVPSLLGGAALGRLVGHLLHRLDAQSGTFADAGTYALVGAAAGLGGMARMTISLCVILLEATGNISNLLPLMLALMAARWVGNVFNEGLYDVHIHLKKMHCAVRKSNFRRRRPRNCICSMAWRFYAIDATFSPPILEEEVPAAAAERTAHAAQVMAADPVCFAPLVTVGDAYDVLRSCRHACFPVVAGGGSTQLAGTVLRSTICMLIQHRAFGAPGDDPSQRNDLRTRALSPLLSSAVFERAYPRFPTVDELDVSETDRGCWLDLRPYADTGPVTIQDCASIQRTYRVFRTLGLRHLVVVDAGNKVRGIITRKDLDHHTLEERLAWAANEAENLESFSVEAHPSTMARFSVS